MQTVVQKWGNSLGLRIPALWAKDNNVKCGSKIEVIAEKGDLVWLDFDPQTGQEQKGRRPAVCVFQKKYNQKIGLALFCPVASHIKGYSFEVVLENHSINGCILSDQVKNLDWTKRNCDFIEKTTEEEINSVVDNIKLMIE